MPRSLKSWVTHFDVASLRLQATILEEKMAGEEFWKERDSAMKIVEELNDKKSRVQDFEQIEKQIKDLNDLIAMLEIESDEAMLSVLDLEFEKLSEDFNNLNTSILFQGEFDKNNVILEFHPGAGGTESQDWADMLYRMYVRWAEHKKFKMQVLDYQPGEEAGLKSASILIKGKNAFGLLKGEKGVHRLVRISPFDSSGRRHTSFASVNVMPEMNENVNIEILDKDLKIDTYRSQGAGGQNVNKTESAVRITHIPTGIVVSCQVERSQISNREIAMNMLRSHLFALKEQEKQAALDKIRGEQKNIEWGSQIRSYVFCPYTMVKDLRSEYQEGDVTKVMDGQIDKFILAYLEMAVKNNA